MQTRGKRALSACYSEGEEEAAMASAAVGRRVESSQADDRRVIRLVRERPLLYTRNTMPVASYYSQVKLLWQEIANEMAWSVAEVRRKWSHIRNSYSRHLRNEVYGARTGKGRAVSKWYLADELDFLREHMATDILQEWLQAVGREDLLSKLVNEKLRQQYRICEDHFEKSCIKFSKNRTVKYLFSNAFPTLNLPTNDGARSSSSQCENVSTSANETFSSSNKPFKAIDVLEDETCSSIQTSPREQPCGSGSVQTALHLSADPPRKRKLSLDEPREAKRQKKYDLDSVTIEDFSKLCDKFMTKSMSQIIKRQIDVKAGYSGNRRPPSYSAYAHAPTFLDMETSDQQTEQMDIKPLINNPWFSLAAGGGCLQAEASHNEDSSGSQPEENSVYFQFFKGIYSDYQELSSKKQRLFRRQCLNVLHALLDQEEEEEGGGASSLHSQNDALNLSSSSLYTEDDKDVKPNKDTILPN